MKTNKGWQKIPGQPRAWLMMAGLACASSTGHAVTAVGSASATVVDSVAVIVTTPPPAPAAPAPAAAPVPAPAVVQTPPALSGTVFSAESFTGSLSTSGPLLRVGGAAPAGAAAAPAQPAAAAQDGAQSTTAAQGSAGAGAAPPAASTATVNVTRKADGSLAVSGGSGLTFAVSQPVNGAVNIEYN